jgi:hypothetical protein
MTEPTKLPPQPSHWSIRFNATDRCEIAEHVRLAVEQATADLRANRDYWYEACQKAYQERDGASLQNTILEGELRDRIAERDEALKATADLRAELASVLADWNDIVKAIGSPTNGGAIGHAKALRRERDEARAELARLTTLRPASEHDGETEVLWWWRFGVTWLGERVDKEPAAGCKFWTPLPPVKEADHD